MMNEEILVKAIAKFPYFKHLFTDTKKREQLSYQTIETGAIPFVEGGYYEFIPLLLKGTMRVSKISDTGREIVLYRVHEGESCILLISSSLSKQPYSATAYVEEETAVINIPVSLYHKEISSFELVRDFTYDLYNKRIANMMSLVEEIVFKKMDKRIAEFLIQNTTKQTPAIEITHEALSIELGTAREVVSRVLKEIEKNKFIQLSRGKITVVQREKLNNYYQQL